MIRGGALRGQDSVGQCVMCWRKGAGSAVSSWCWGRKLIGREKTYDSHKPLRRAGARLTEDYMSMAKGRTPQYAFEAGWMPAQMPP